MIKLVELECSNCGAPLKKVSEDMAKCPSCGTEFLIDEGQPENVTNIYHNDTSKTRFSTILVVWTVVAVCFIAVVLGVFLSYGRDTKDYNYGNSVSQDKTEKLSAGFQELAKRIYGTSWEKLSQEEKNQITYVGISHASNWYTIEYALEDKEHEVIEFSGDLYFALEDLCYLQGLKSLRIDNSNVPTIVLKQLENLEEIWSFSTPEELAENVKNPENIKTIGCYSATNLIGIDTFLNLEYVYLSDGDLMDIGSLSALKHLKKLEIVRGDAIVDFGVLHSLSGLESLSIKSENLKDISFVAQMKSLKELKLENTIVMDISHLEGLTSLQILELLRNDEITDLSALSSLTGLELLTLDLSANQYVPDASGWKNLKQLSVDGADDLSFLTHLTGLVTLELDGVGGSQLGYLSELGNLEELTLSNLHGDVENLDALTSLVKLKYLDLSSSDFSSACANIQSVFGIPALEEINISDGEFELDFSQLPENGNLKILRMNRVKLRANVTKETDGIFTYMDYDEVNLADVISHVSKFPNLEELYVQSNKLTDVNFAVSLSKLKKLDVTDNYITDLRPLGNLSRLETVWCGENSISQGKDLGENVTLILDSVGLDVW